jgi:hypothetical protein
MENRDQLTWRLWGVEGLGKSLLIGGILFYVPLVNLLLLGYWGLWMRRLQAGRASTLPDWLEWRSILRETIRLLPLFVVYVALPVAVIGLLVWGVGGIFEWISLDFAANSLAWLPMSAVAVLIPQVMVLAVLRLNRHEGLQSAFEFNEIFRLMLQRARGCLLPILQFYGILLLGWPVLGFAMHLGLVVLLGHLVVVLRGAETDLNSGAI